MKPLTFVILGSGGIARTHVNSLLALPEVRPVGFQDVSPEALDRWKGQFPEAQFDTDADRLLAATRPDLACVCSPNVAHAAQTRSALRAGAHVMCEKPMAMNRAEAEAMKQAQEAAGKLGAINFSNRCLAAFRFARELVAAGELGRLNRFHVQYLQSFVCAELTPFSWRNDIEVAGFGALGDLGAHMIDSTSFISGLLPRRAVGVIRTAVADKQDAAGTRQKITTDTHASFLLEYDGGVIGTFETSQAAPGYGNFFQVEISGSGGLLRVCSEEPDSLILYSGGQLTRYGTWKSDLPRVRVPTGFLSRQMPKNNLEAFVRAIRGEPVEYPSFQDGLAVQSCLDSIAASSQSRAWMEI